jgi:hypothetical protein
MPIMKKIITLIIGYIIHTALLAQPRYFIDSHFPGGNIDIDKITEDTVWLKPDYRDSEGFWFYWNFKVRQAQHKTLNFCFKHKSVFSDYGPAFSRDNGKTWHWLDKKYVYDSSFSFNFTKNDTVVQFCMSIPYTERNLREVLKIGFVNESERKI